MHIPLFLLLVVACSLTIPRIQGHDVSEAKGSAVADGYSPCFSVNAKYFAPESALVLKFDREAWILGNHTDLWFAFDPVIEKVEVVVPPAFAGQCVVSQDTSTPQAYTLMHCQPNATLPDTMEVHGSIVAGAVASWERYHMAFITVSGVIGDARYLSAYDFTQPIPIYADPEAALITLRPPQDRPGFLWSALGTPAQSIDLELQVCNDGPASISGVAMLASAIKDELDLEDKSGKGVVCSAPAQTDSGLIPLLKCVVDRVDVSQCVTVTVGVNISPQTPTDTLTPITFAIQGTEAVGDVTTSPVLKEGDMVRGIYGPRIPLCFDGEDNEDYNTSVNAVAILDVPAPLILVDSATPRHGGLKDTNDVCTWKPLRKDMPQTWGCHMGTLSGYDMCGLNIPFALKAGTTTATSDLTVYASGQSDNMDDFDGYPVYIPIPALVAQGDDAQGALLEVSVPYQPWNLGDKPLFPLNVTLTNHGPNVAQDVELRVMIHLVNWPKGLPSPVKMHNITSSTGHCEMTISDTSEGESEAVMKCQMGSIAEAHAVWAMALFTVGQNATATDADAGADVPNQWFGIAHQEYSASNQRLAALGPQAYPLIFKMPKN